MCLFLIGFSLTFLDFSPALIAYIFLAGSIADLNSTTVPRNQLTLVNPNQADQGAGHLASNSEGICFLKCVNCRHVA